MPLDKSSQFQIGPEDLREAIEGAGIGIWSHEAGSGQIAWSERCAELYGVPGRLQLGLDELMELIHPEDRDVLAAAIAKAMDPGGEGFCEVDYRVRLPDEELRWIVGRGTCHFQGEGEDRRPTRITGTAVDITDRKLVEEGAAREQQWLQRVLDSLPVGLSLVDPGRGEISFVNKAGIKMSGGSLGTGRISIDEARPNSHLTTPDGIRIPPTESPARRVASGERIEGEEVDWHIDDQCIPLLVSGQLVPPGNGHESVGVITYQSIARIRESEQTIRFINEASRSLASLQDFNSTMQQVASVSVPAFADWCAVDVMVDETTYDRIAIAHNDPEKLKFVREIEKEYPADPDAKTGVWSVLKSGQPQLVEFIPPEMLVAAARDERHLDLIQQLQLASYICVPLFPEGGPKSTITFATAESGRHYNHASLEVALDIARRARVAVENAILYQKVRRADQRKDEFLATLAHELRNPLAPVKAGIETLRLMNGDPDQLWEVVSTMERQTGQLTRLIDDLLDVSRITRGRLSLRIEDADLRGAVETAVESTSESISQRNQHLEVDLPEDRVKIPIDRHRIAQVLSNLLDNASKYSPENSTITLRVVPSIDDVRIVVSDQGVGISSGEIDEIFEMFNQLDRTSAAGYAGLGIGLTLVKRLIELHGGSIAVESEGEDRGTTFTITLLREPGDRVRRQLAPTEVETGPVDAGPYSILVVDDNVDAARMLRMLLQMKGHDVRLAHNGEDAIGIAEEMQPDLILMDVAMPRMDGYQATRKIRASDWGRDIYIVALTGFGQQSDRERSIEAGFDDHLVKPVDPATLDGVIAEVRN